MDLLIRTTTMGSTVVVSLSGEVDLSTLPRLADALTKAAAPAASIVVDLDGVLVLDDTALGLLLGAAGRARLSGGDLVVVCSASSLRERLATTAFDRAVRVVASLGAIGAD